jgi:PRTRC genetic system protein A
MTAELSPLDAAIQSSCPTVLAPHQGELPPLRAGKRLILAADGLYLEVRSTSLHVLQRIAVLQTPYGTVAPFVRLACGPIPRDLLRRATEAAAATRVEVAFAIVADGQGGYALVQPEVHSASASHITYADALPDDLLVLDIHSHGEGAAFFSSTDNASDLARPGPYIALVIGRCSTAPEIAARLVAPPWLCSIPPESLRPLLSLAN